MISEIKKCRICESSDLENVLSFGELYLSGIFPKTKEEKITKGPVDLVFCSNCGLLQLKQSYPLDEMYGENYGYRSGLNKSMVNHLENKIHSLESFVSLSKEDIVVDIGSNDATSLKAYTSDVKKVGIDPSALKFKEFYTDDIELIPDFFSAEKYLSSFSNQKAKIITSIAMFYDLESPLSFVEDIKKCLDDEGIWHFEQSYMPLMLKINAYDTICQEHLEFYSLKVVEDMLSSKGLRIIDVELNDVNGGSFAVTACKNNASYKSNSKTIDELLENEDKLSIDTLKPYQAFNKRVLKHKKDIKNLIESILSGGKTILGYGASTKGNILLQFCNITENEIPYIAEVNPDKFGSYTPGTKIPIISENEAHEMNPDYFLVLPWHFKDMIVEKEEEFLKGGGKLIFPLPELEIIEK